MSWERALFALFDDLEQQAEGLALVARDAEVAEHGRAEYSSVDLESRVHGSVGSVVACHLQGGHQVRGVLTRAGAGWLLADDESGAWVVNLGCLTRITGLGSRAVAPEARGIVARLGLGSVLRRLAESRVPVQLALADGSQARGRVGRIGADFVEVLDETVDGASCLVPWSAIAAVRGR